MKNYKYKNSDMFRNKIRYICNQNRRKQIFDCIKKVVYMMEDGSMTLETAIVLPIFLMSVLAFFNFFVIINYQNIMQHSMNNTAQEIGRYAYTVNHISDSELKKLSEDIDNELVLSGITLGYAWNKILSDEVKIYTDKANVYNGVNGISLLNSEINNDGKGINDLKADYVINTNFLGKKINFILENRCYFRLWIGESIVKTDSENENGKTVYITRTGTVYHLKDTCSYIKIVTSKVKYKEIEKLRNVNGSKYRPCLACVRTEMNNEDIVYVTSDGKRYHSNEKCSRIKREVTAIDISQVGTRTVCTKCNKS